MEDGGVAGVVVELTVPGLTGETVGRPRAPAVSTGAVTGPALVELRSVVREVAGGAAQAAAAGHQVGLPVAGETLLTSPTLVTARPAPLTLPAGRVEPVARAALLYTDSRLAQNTSNTAQLGGCSQFLPGGNNAADRSRSSGRRRSGRSGGS